MKNTFQLLILFLLSISVSAQNANRKFEGFKETNNTLEISVSDGTYRICAYSDKIIETSFIPKGETFNPKSHAVDLIAKPSIYKISENGNSLSFSTDGISATITKSPFQISYSYKNKPLISEKNGYTKKDSTEILDFNINTTETLYGGGARALGMNRRGNRLQLYNRAHYGYGDRAELLNFTIPVVLSSQIYAIHFDNAPIGFLDFDSKKNNTLAYGTISGRKTYQVMASDSWTDLIDSYTYLTGKQPMPPRWTFGNLSSRFGYRSQTEAETTIKKFRDEKIPVDAIIFDLYWFGKEVKGTMGNLEIDRDNFMNLEKMVEDFNKSGVKTVLITEPFVLTTSKRWNEAVSKNILATDDNGKPFTYDFYFGNTGLIDIFSKKGHDWFWNIYKELAETGVAGVWGDLGEPEVHPSALRHATGTADEVHNIYGHNWAKLVFDGYKKDFSNQRPFILMRSGYSGSQRYGMIPWSGDVGRSWGGLKSQLEISLQMGMQGLGYMHSDLGGFAGENVDNELYVRWLQYGVFQPVFRPHAQESVPPEAVYREPKTKELAKKAIELRYKLLGYNYTLAFDNNQKGTPLMRPLLFDEPNNEKVFAISDEYFWGDNFLIAPVTEAGQKQKDVYFPAGSAWFNFYSDKKYDGSTTETIDLVEEYIPTFVRAGSFIPMVDLVQTTKDYSTKHFELHYYHDTKVSASDGKLYNDDGQTPDAYEKGRYEILHFKSELQSDFLTIEIKNEKGSELFEQDRRIKLIVHNINDKPKKIKVDGKKAKFRLDKNKNVLAVDVKFDRNQYKTITIQF